METVGQGARGIQHPADLRLGSEYSALRMDKRLLGLESIPIRYMPVARCIWTSLPLAPHHENVAEEGIPFSHADSKVDAILDQLRDQTYEEGPTTYSQ